MIQLSLMTEPYWIDLGLDVKVKVRPCTSAIFYQARAFMNQQLQKLAEDYRTRKEVGTDASNLPNLDDENMREALAEQYLILGLAHAGIIEWQGVLETNSDQQAKLTHMTKLMNCLMPTG